MGDRGNVVVSGNNSTVYLYTHWAGSELPEIVRSALKRGRDRWDDVQYVARIIFSEMIKDEVMETTGYGITSREFDGGITVFVDVDTQVVDGITFEEYVESEDEDES